MPTQEKQQRQTQTIKIIRRRQSLEELTNLHNKLREWHLKNKDLQYGDPEAIREAVMRGSDRAHRTEVDIWYSLPVKVKVIKRSSIIGRVYRPRIRN